MSGEQTQKQRPGSPDEGAPQEQEFVKVDPGGREANEVIEKLKQAQVVKPRKPRRACCCC
jgi:hypothetical protein